MLISRITCGQGFLEWKTGRDRFATAGDADELGMPFIFVEPPSLSRRVVNQARARAHAHTHHHHPPASAAAS